MGKCRCTKCVTVSLLKLYSTATHEKKNTFCCLKANLVYANTTVQIPL